MPVLVQSILAALPRVGSVLALCGFIMLVFSIVGMELFKGVLHYRCALPGFIETANHPGSAAEGITEGIDGARRALQLAAASATTSAIGALQEGAQLGAGMLHAGGGVGSSFGGGGGGGGGGAMGSMGLGRALGAAQEDYDSGTPCRLGMPPGDGYGQCEAGSTCMYFDDNPSNGLMSFDSVGVAFVVLLQALTFDDWTEPMYALMASISVYSGARPRRRYGHCWRCPAATTSPCPPSPLLPVVVAASAGAASSTSPVCHAAPPLAAAPLTQRSRVAARRRSRLFRPHRDDRRLLRRQPLPRRHLRGVHRR